MDMPLVSECRSRSASTAGIAPATPWPSPWETVGPVARNAAPMVPRGRTLRARPRARNTCR